MPESTTSDNPSGAALPRPLWIALGVLTVAAYTIGLGFPLVGPDEPRYAQVAREMMERGDWITPTLGGHPWFEKPALLYWLEILSYRVFGVNEAAARFGPALCGLGTVVALCFIGRSLRGKGVCGVGGYFALIGASTMGLIIFSHAASFDIVVTFPITAALACFWCYESGDRRIGWLFGFWAFVGVGLLAKGLIGIVLPVGILGCFYVLSQRLPSPRIALSTIWGTLVSLTIAAVWYVPMYLRHGWQFIDEFIIQHHFDRFTSNKYQHPQPFYFFLWVLPLMTLPWLPFVITGAWRAIRSAAKPSGDDVDSPSPSVLTVSPSRLLLFALSWVLGPLVFFSISGSKLPGYIIPAIPGAVILAALVAHPLASRSKTWKYGVVGTASATLLASVILLFTVVPRYASEDSTGPLIDAATGRGFVQNRMLMLHTISHNAEFYAGSRIERDEAGQIVEVYGSQPVGDDIKAHGGDPVLVIVPTKYAGQLTQDPTLNSEFIAHNNELTIAAVSLR